jgi:hypothetical protein
MSEEKQSEDKGATRGPDKLAVWVIGFYLVIEIIVLSLAAIICWGAPDWFTTLIADEKVRIFQKLVLSACAAGIGGAVFMVRQFYLNVAYGPPYGNREYLRNAEIPRYVLLPFSSVILGPVGLCLLLAGSIVFGTFSSGQEIPIFSVIAVAFLLGFAYHDTLNSLRKLSRKLFDWQEEDETLKSLRTLKTAKDENLISNTEHKQKREELLNII